jgi:hypothetical protein
MMSRARAACVIVGTMILTACVDTKPQAADTSASVTNAPAANEHVDTVRLDTSVVKHPPSDDALPPTVSRSPLPVTGETRREPPVSRDPMPPLRGETSKGPPMPVYRDSTRGPMMEIDSKGQPRPIKR